MPIVILFLNLPGLDHPPLLLIVPTEVHELAISIFLKAGIWGVIEITGTADKSACSKPKFQDNRYGDKEHRVRGMSNAPI